jgi:hypothetical protein
VASNSFVFSKPGTRFSGIRRHITQLHWGPVEETTKVDSGSWTIRRRLTLDSLCRQWKSDANHQNTQAASLSSRCKWEKVCAVQSVVLLKQQLCRVFIKKFISIALSYANSSNSGRHLRFLLFVTLQRCRSNVSCKKQIAENTFYSVAAQTYFRSWPAFCRSQENGNAAQA